MDVADGSTCGRLTKSLGRTRTFREHLIAIARRLPGTLPAGIEPLRPDHAMPHAPPPKPERIHRQAVEKLTRHTFNDVIDGKKVRRTLHFTFPGGRKNRRSSVTFLNPEHVPPFDGDEAWFLVELVIAKPWSYWRAVRQVEPPRA